MIEYDVRLCRRLYPQVDDDGWCVIKFLPYDTRTAVVWQLDGTVMATAILPEDRRSSVDLSFNPSQRLMPTGLYNAHRRLESLQGSFESPLPVPENYLLQRVEPVAAKAIRRA